MRIRALLVIVCVVASSTGCGGNDHRRAAARPPETPVVEFGGSQLAKVPDVGAVYSGDADFGSAPASVSAAKASDPPKLDGVVAGPGLTVTSAGPFSGLLQVRLNVPDPPSGNSIPAVLHRHDDGTVGIEPALWDPGTKQMVVWAHQLSDRWGAWYGRRNWAKEVFQTGTNRVGGTDDLTSDVTKGRTGPLPCRDDPPGWSHTTAQASSLHVCNQSNHTSDGLVLDELVLKSNMRTALAIRLPDAPKEYVQTGDVPDDLSKVLSKLSGVNYDQGRVLLGDQELSIGFRQPTTPLELATRSYIPYPLIIANRIFAMLGSLPISGEVGVVAGATKCAAEHAGIDTLKTDLVPDADVPRSEDSFAKVLRCAVDVLRDPAIGFGVVKTAAAAVGVTTGLEGVDAALKAIAPTASRIATGIAVPPSVTNAWHGAFDPMAETINLTLDGSAPPPPPTPPPVAEETDPRAFLDAFFQAWLRNDVDAMYRYGPKALVDNFVASFPPAEHSGAEVHWEQLTCEMGSSGAGGCDVGLMRADRATPAVERLLVTYSERDSQGHLQLDSLQAG